MTQPTKFPEYVQQLETDEQFQFSCHKDVPCFTECCRMLELSLTPYDALRLRYGTGQSSSQLLDNYIIIERDPGEPFPRLYLTMIDDGRASCVFVGKNGCKIYAHRPSACRAYPLGRAVVRQEDNSLKEHFVLMKEEHCKGFLEPTHQTPTDYIDDQELNKYNSFNDSMSPILQHESIRKGFIPSKKQVDSFILALYDLDTFRKEISENRLAGIPESFDRNRLKDDVTLLQFGIDWLYRQLFSSFRNTT